MIKPNKISPQSTTAVPIVRAFMRYFSNSGLYFFGLTGTQFAPG